MVFCRFRAPPLPLLPEALRFCPAAVDNNGLDTKCGFRSFTALSTSSSDTSGSSHGDLYSGLEAVGVSDVGVVPRAPFKKPEIMFFAPLPKDPRIDCLLLGAFWGWSLPTKEISSVDTDLNGIKLCVPLLRSSLICLLISRSMKGVSPNGKTLGMRLCHTSGPGIVSKNGFDFSDGLPSAPGMNFGLIGEITEPRSVFEGPLPDKSRFLCDGWLAGPRSSSVAEALREFDFVGEAGLRVEVSFLGELGLLVEGERLGDFFLLCESLPRRGYGRVSAFYGQHRHAIRPGDGLPGSLSSSASLSLEPAVMPAFVEEAPGPIFAEPGNLNNSRPCCRCS